MAAIARYCRRSDRAPGAINLAILNLYFGPSVWLRGLIKPPPGYGIAYIDWRSRNSASRPRCPAMRRCRPPISPATPISPSPSKPAPSLTTPPRPRTALQRELFKQCVLGVQYGMEADGSGAAHRPAADRRARSAAGSPRDLPNVLALVRRGRRYRHAHRLAAHGFRLARPCRRGRQSAIACAISPCRLTAPKCCASPCCLATERGIEVCAPVARRRADLRPARSPRGRRRRHARRHGRSVARRPGRLRARAPTRHHPLARPLHGRPRPRDVEPRYGADR